MGPEPAPRSHLSTATVIWMVTAAAWHAPLGDYLANLTAVAQPLRHGLVFLSLAVGACLATFGLARFGMGRAVATYGVTTALALFWSGRALTITLGPWSGLAVGTAALVLTWLTIWRLRSLTGLHVAFFALAVYLTLAPWLEMDLSQRMAPLEQTVATESSIGPGEVGYQPDIFVVILDGYPGIQTMAGFDGWQGKVVDELGERGFNVQPAWSAYATTDFSLSGLLDASYPVRPVDGFASETRPSQRLITGGEASMFDFLKRAGYDVTMLESPWYGYRCGDVVDTCVGAPLLDDLMFFTLQQSYLGALIDRQFGSAWIHGAHRTWDWLEDNVADIEGNRTPDFVLAHVVLPHEPYMLDPDCNVRYRPQYDRNAVLESDVPAFLDQARCVDRMMMRLADAVSPDAVLLFTADHGSVLTGQYNRPVSAWTTSQMSERLSTFFALRAPEACQPNEPVVVQNILRGVSRCMGADAPDLDLRLFPNSLFLEGGRFRMVEVSAGDLRTVLGS